MPRIASAEDAYLAVGAQICGPPAIDREFKTIDFLTLLDLPSLPERIIERYLSWRNRKRPVTMQSWKAYRHHQSQAA
jgi:putative hemolysin